MPAAAPSFLGNILATAVPSEITSLSDEDAFRIYTAALTARGLRVGSLVLLAIDLAWLLVDQIAFRDHREVAERFVGMRVFWAITLALGYAGLHIPAVTRRPIAVAAAIIGVQAVVIGWFAGSLGSLTAPWFHLTYAIAFLPAFLLIPLRLRLATALLVPAALFAGAAASSMQLRGSPMLGTTLGYLAFITLITLAAGHLIYALIQQTFTQARAELRASRALADLNGTLEARVREQTRELRSLAAHLDDAREQERAHISRELHDELGQELTALRYALSLAKLRFERDPAALGKNLAELEALIARTTATTRQIVSELRPRVVDDLGLSAAIEFLLRRAERAGLAVDLALTPVEIDVDLETANVAYRIVQESLTNVLRHAQASRVRVVLSLDGAELSIQVRDDGVGLSARREGGAGIVGMRERAEAVGGRLRVEGAAEGGTAVEAWLPARTAATAGGAS